MLATECAAPAPRTSRIELIGNDAHEEESRQDDVMRIDQGEDEAEEEER